MSETRRTDVLRTTMAHARFTPGVSPHIAARIFNEPLAIDPFKCAVILAVVGPRIGLIGMDAGLSAIADEHVQRDMVMAAGPGQTLVRRDRTEDYDLVNGIALIDVMGTIVKRNGSGMLAYSGNTSTEALRETIAVALADSRVNGILLRIDSYGGEAVGTPDVARYIYEARGTKPIWSIADDSAYSAGEYLAAAAERSYVSSTGGRGSIGVIYLHVDESEALAEEGIKVTPIFAGDMKTDGGVWAPLSERAKTHIQSRVNAIWSRFTADIGQFRNLPTSKIQDMEAGTFYGADAVLAGLADGVATFDDVLAEMTTYTTAPGARRAQGGMGMEKEKGAAPEKPSADVIELAAHRTALETAKTEERVAERTRVTGIAAAAKTAGRLMPAKAVEALAASFVEKGLSVDEAKSGFLDATAKYDATGGEILGHTDEAAAAEARTPKLLAREDVLTRRFQTGLASRVGGQGVRTLKAPQEGV